MLERSQEELFAMSRTAGWLLRLLDSDIPFGDSFFACAGWALNGIRELATRIHADIRPPAAKTKAAAQVRALLKDLVLLNPRRLDDCLESLYNDSELLQKEIRLLLEKYLAEAAGYASEARSLPFHRRLSRIFGLNAKAAEFCFFIFTISQYDCVESYFEDTIELNRYRRRHLLAKMLGISQGEVMEIQGTLSGMGILTDGHRGACRLTDSIESALTNGTGRNLQSLFCRPVPKSTVPVEEFHIAPEMRAHALGLMGDRSARPAHLLLYGAPGSGKTSFAGAIAQELGVKAWAVQCRDDDNSMDRRASLTACLKMAASKPGSFVLVDEAERLLDTDSTNRESSAKAWINELLERRNTRIIWITNRVHHLDPAVRRRFGYSIYFRNPGRAESLAMWNSVAARVGVEELLPAAAREEFASRYPVPVATMELALRQAKAHAGKKDFVAWVERVISAQVILQNDGITPRRRVDNPAEYDPAAVCAATPVDKFIGQVATLARNLEAGRAPGCGSILFYGPPGTGKSALARHLARTLDRELLVRRASDLLGPYVGETEMKIAQAFQEAEEKKAVLLIDEADSFIFGRGTAEHSWEQTMVNEFLTQLESFHGLCICTTNFRKHLDAAAMRRFTTRLEFSYAGPEQLKCLYRRLLAPLVSEELNAEQEQLLCAQKRLAPGDFRVVRQRMLLEEKPDHALMLAALIGEQRLKLESEAKSVGF